MKLETWKMLGEIYSVILKDMGAYGGFPFYGFLILLFLLLEDFAFAQQLVASLVTVSAAVVLARLAHFKPRPGRKIKKYEAFYERIDNSAFPSIHAARAVIVSFALFSKLPSALPLLVLMTLIVFASRLHFKRHDWTDVLIGAILGAVLGLLFF